MEDTRKRGRPPGSRNRIQRQDIGREPPGDGGLLRFAQDIERKQQEFQAQIAQSVALLAQQIAEMRRTPSPSPAGFDFEMLRSLKEVFSPTNEALKFLEGYMSAYREGMQTMHGILLPPDDPIEAQEEEEEPEPISTGNPLVDGLAGLLPVATEALRRKMAQAPPPPPSVPADDQPGVDAPPLNQTIDIEKVKAAYGISDEQIAAFASNFRKGGEGENAVAA